MVRQATGSVLLGGLAFSIGLLALLLGRSELFTEDFLVPITAVVAKRATPAQLAKLWSGTLVTNLAGGWSIMWVVIAAFPELHDQTIEATMHFVGSPLSLRTFALAVLAGPTITSVSSCSTGVVESLLIFGALHTGRATGRGKSVVRVQRCTEQVASRP